MIAFLPPMYPDELYYSLIARYHTRSGHIDIISTADIFYQDRRNVPPDFEFLGKLNPAPFASILEHLSFSDQNEQQEYTLAADKPYSLLSNHTMYPYYARYMPSERRKGAYAAMINMDTDRFYRTIAIPQRRMPRYVRFCPMCAEADREAYGETYWHRQSNMFGVNICPLHACRLHTTDINISPKPKTDFLPAEEIIPKKEKADQCDNATEIRFAKYVAEVFTAPLDMDNDVPIGKVMHENLRPPFVSARGVKRDMERIRSAFAGTFEGIDTGGFGDIFQLEKIFSGKRISTPEVCALAMAVGLAPRQIINPVLPEISKRKEIDEQVFRLRQEGKTNKEIAGELKLPYTLCKQITPKGK